MAATAVVTTSHTSPPLVVNRWKVTYTDSGGSTPAFFPTGTNTIGTGTTHGILGGLPLGFVINGVRVYAATTGLVLTAAYGGACVDENSPTLLTDPTTMSVIVFVTGSVSSIVIEVW